MIHSSSIEERSKMPTLHCIHVYDFRKYVCLLSTIAEDTLALYRFNLLSSVFASMFWSHVSRRGSADLISDRRRLPGG